MVKKIYKRKRWKYFKIFLLVAMCALISFFYVPLRDAIYGVPFITKVAPMLRGDGFLAEIEVPCNKFYKREVGFILDPPLYIDKISDAQSAVSGNVRISVKQEDGEIEEVIDLSKSGWSLGSMGIRSKVVLRYKPIGSIFCDKQRIILEANSLNINFKDHNIKVYVSRDRRP